MSFLKGQFSMMLYLACSIGLLYSGSSLAESNKKGRLKFKCPEAELSKEQKMSIRAMHKTFRSQEADWTQEEKRAAKQEVRQRVLTEVLTSDAQREALLACENRYRKEMIKMMMKKFEQKMSQENK